MNADAGRYTGKTSSSTDSHTSYILKCMSIAHAMEDEASFPADQELWIPPYHHKGLTLSVVSLLTCFNTGGQYKHVHT